MKTVVVTGGAGFIGSHFVKYLLSLGDEYKVIVLDALTYAGRLENLDELRDNPRFEFVKGDIRDKDVVESVMSRCDYAAHLAAETHNDRAILDAGEFISTDVYGTFVLLEAAKKYEIKRFLHISTDEVYGSTTEGKFTEESPIQPNMPYAASKAGGELLAKSYYKTHGTPVIIARPSNNYGQNQYPEKLIPFFTSNAIDDKPLPLYGNGRQVRDWLYVRDTCSALELLLTKGVVGEAYNISANEERENVEVTSKILYILSKPDTLIRYVEDRPGHDVRYALDASKIRKLGWTPKVTFDDALRETVEWYVDNQKWWRSIKEDQTEYKSFMQTWYNKR